MFSDYNFADLASIFVMQGFSGLSLFAVFVLMSLGLAIIFGQMGVINMAHGEFMILGAYVTWLTGKFFSAYLPSIFGIYFFVAIALAFLCTALLGTLVEKILIRHLYKRPPRHAAGDMGSEPDSTAVLSFAIWSPRSRR
ncbi:hypothetical protein PYX05_30390 [Klebsiella pneumoniae]|nr:hypothetical protein [Klebsiella pneumoniae]